MLRKARRGIALLNVLIFTFLTTMFLVVGIQFSQGALKQGRSTKSDAQVYNVALAGINHAVFWLQKQDPSQPLDSFDPRAFDAAAPDEDAETTEQQLGLVHEFLVDGSRNLWGRYEVARSEHAPARDGLATGPASPLYASPPAWTAENVTDERGGVLPDTIWRIRSRAYLFERPTGSEPFAIPSPDVRPLPTITLEGEVRRLVIRNRHAAIYSFKDGASAGESSGDGETDGQSGAQNQHIWIDDNAASGDTTRVEVSVGNARHYAAHSTKYYLDNTVVFSPSENGLLGASDPANANFVDPSLTAQLKYVFGVTQLEDVKGLADAYYETTADVPEPQPQMSFIYLKPSSGVVTFKEGGSTPTLSGGGVLFVEGDLIIDGSSGVQNWTGLIFVTGRYKQYKSSNVTGAVMCGGTFFLKGEGSDRAKIFFHQGELDRVNAVLGKFKLDRSTLRLVDGAATQTY